ncbi:MAG TPA: TatD family hydrolase [Chloroflexota bacterium]|nr:TatD family hydrolase [Chloroflexota bacterium]
MISSVEGRRQLPDTHAHLDAESLFGDLEAVIARAAEAGIGPILAVGENLESSRTAIQIAHRYHSVYAAVGLHPHQASRFDEEAAALEMLLGEEKVVAVGEIGLDFTRESMERAVQQRAFETQLEWARHRGLPVSIHSRGAETAIVSALQPSDRAVLHCYGGDGETAKHALAKGSYISFAGNLTFPRAEELRSVAAQVPADRLLLESDAPVLAPQPRRGRRNEPAYVRMTADVLADVRGMTPEDLAARVSANAASVFGWALS